MKPGSSTQRVYFALAAFNVGTLVVSLFLGASLLATYRGSVATNEQWAGRLARYAQLGQLVTEANAPGNDVFVDKDVAGQRERLARTRADVDATFTAAHADLSTLSAEHQAALGAELAQARVHFDAMMTEATAIFATFERGELDTAGTHMGQMDQAFARTSASLDALRTRVQAVQRELFARQLDDAEATQRGQYLLMALAVLMVAGVVAYGVRLQRTMAAQQRAVDRANAGMRRVLDNVEQGLVLVDREGVVRGERSGATDALLGCCAEGAPLHEVVSAIDPKAGAWLRAGWSLVTDDCLPLEVALAQLPRRITAKERTLELQYRPVLEGERLDRVLVVVSDVTQALRSERLELQQRETLAMFERVMRDRAGFVEAFDECDRLVDAICRLGDRDLSVVRRQLHTLKGNAATLGLTAFSLSCHQAEDYLQDTVGDLSREQADGLRHEWEALRTRLHSLLGQQRDVAMSVDRDAWEAVVAALSEDAVPRSDVRRMVEALALDPAARRLEWLAEQAQSTAARLSKGPLHVVVESHGVRFDRARWSPFFSSLVHLVRNCVDHGLEAPSDRAALGKGVGTLTFRTRVVGSALHVEVQDDGRGINEARLLERARQQGFSPATGVDAMFLEGISTKDDVSELSGRGIGMGAVRAACEALGGTLSVETAVGQGSTFRFTFGLQGVAWVEAPAPRQAPSGTAEGRARNDFMKSA
ncbi:MAG: ATP-binding protein [Myxococcaceae bacterium]|nr:ATP-binding protein [Myxococcaceae bacterium]